MSYKEQVLKLHAEGKTKAQIMEQSGCSKNTVDYYCKPDQQVKYKARSLKRYYKKKAEHPYFIKLKFFRVNKRYNKNKALKDTKAKELLRLKLRRFHNDERKGVVMSKDEHNFTVEDIINKLGENPTCYLTGTPIDIYKPRTYQFDHILPRSRGGDNSLNNLGVCISDANQAKRDKTPEEFFHLCKQILEHNGFQITKLQKPQQVST